MCVCVFRVHVPTGHSDVPCLRNKRSLPFLFSNVLVFAFRVSQTCCQAVCEIGQDACVDTLAWGNLFAFSPLVGSGCSVRAWSVLSAADGPAESGLNA